MNFAQFTQKLQDNFFSRLDRKTGWGKIEIRAEYMQAVIETLATDISECILKDTQDKPMRIYEAQRELDSLKENEWERELTATEQVRRNFLINLIRSAQTHDNE